MNDKQERIDDMETILTLSERILAVAKANIAKALAAEDAQRRIIEPERERTQE